MAVLQGVITLSGGASVRSAATAVEIHTLSKLLWPGGEHLLADPFSGTLVSNLPVSMTPRELTAAIALSPADDVYQNLQFLPPIFPVGFVTETQTFDVRVWNAFRKPVEVVSLSSFGTEGLLFDMLVGADFDQTQERIFSLTVTPDGPALIDATYTFGLLVDGVTRTYLFRVVGTRALAWQFKPEWGRGFQASYAYKTETRTSRSGREQRRAVRHNARVGYDFTVVLNEERHLRYRTIMAGWQNLPFIMPDFATRTTAEASIANEAETVTLTKPLDFVQPGDAVVFIDGQGGDTRTVVSQVGNVLTFTPALTRDFAFGTEVYTGLAGYVDQTLSGENQTRGVAVRTIRFQALPPSTTPPTTSPPLTYNGRELFTTRPNWAAGVGVDTNWDRETIDFDRGRTTTFNPVAFPTETRRMVFLGRNRAAVAALRALFDRTKGARGEFYSPTWTHDLKPLSAVFAGGTSILVEGIDVIRFLEDSTVHKGIALVLQDGTVVPNRVYGMTEVDGNAEFTLADPWPEDVPLSEMAMLCWMPVCTMATDILTVAWITDSVANVTMAFRTLEDL